jgi:hypothetical protein
MYEYWVVFCHQGAEAPSNMTQSNAGPARGPNAHGEYFVHTS